MKKQNVHIFYPGIYKFTWPYLNWYQIPKEVEKQNDDKLPSEYEILMAACDVEIQVGGRAIKDGKMAIITITSTLTKGTSVTNRFEDIATNLSLVFFNELRILPESVRWIQHYPVEQDDIFSVAEWYEVFMQWDKKKKRYLNPQWVPLSTEKVETIFNL